MMPKVRLPSASTIAPVSVATSIDRVRVLLRGAGQRVGQDQPALGVGVEHLDGLAAVHAQDVTRAGGGAGRHVLGQCQPAGDVDAQAEPGGRDDGGEDGGGAAHVALHRLVVARGLEGDAARVVGDALADQREGLRRLGVRVRELDQARRMDRALTDAEDAAVAALGERLLVEHLDLDAVLLARGRGDGGEGLGGEVVRRGVDQVAGAVDLLGQRDRAVGGGLVGLVTRLGAEQRDLGERLLRAVAVLRVLLAALVDGEGVRAEEGALGDGLDVLGRARAAARRRPSWCRTGHGPRLRRRAAAARRRTSRPCPGSRRGRRPGRPGP